MSELMDLLKVLWEPGAVFERVREKPAFWWPFLGLCIVQIVIGVMQHKTQMGMYGGPDSNHAVIPISTFRAQFGRERLNGAP